MIVSKWKKIFIAVAIFTALIILIVYIMSFFQYTDRTKNYLNNDKADPISLNELTKPSSKSLMFHDQVHSLFFDPSNASVEIIDNNVNQSYVTNPSKIDEMDINTSLKNQLKSQISITYIDPKDTLKTMYSYEDSVKKGQYKLFETKNGFVIEYTFGDLGDGLIVPDIAEKNSFDNNVLNKCTDEQVKKILKYYHVKNLESMSQDEKKEFLETFPAADKKATYYVLRPIAEFQKKQIATILEGAGYTSEMCAQDEKPIGDKQSNAEIFVVPVQYTLDQGDLLVSIDTKQVKYNKKYPIVKIELLPFFGSGDNTQDGKILLPDGSGAIVEFNNGKNEQYSVPLYGKESINAEKQIQNTKENPLNTMPVFGIMTPKKSILAIIEQGDALATIHAQTSGMLSNQNTVYAEFSTIPYMIEGISDTQQRKMTAKFMSMDEISVRYMLIGKEEQTYIDLAKTYQKYLLERQKLKVISAQEPKLMVNYIGAIDKKTNFLGIGYSKIISLTPFTKALSITQQIASDVGAENLIFRYEGWQSGGVASDFLSNTPEKRLGGEKDFNALVKWLKDNNIPAYFEIENQKVYNTSSFSGFKPNSHAARNVVGEAAKLYPYNLATGIIDKTKSSHYLLTPDLFQYSLNKAEEFANKYQVNLSLSSMGKSLYGDYKKNKYIDRQRALSISQSALENLSSSFLTSTGNIYSLNNASGVFNSPLFSSQNEIADESVPFVQIVLKGVIPFTGSPINLSDEQSKEFLASLETGASLQFTFISESNSLVKNTEYEYLHMVRFNDWQKEMTNMYTQTVEMDNITNHHDIVSRKQIAKDVYQTTYSNGINVIFNYSDQNYGEVLSMSYMVLEKGEK